MKSFFRPFLLISLCLAAAGCAHQKRAASDSGANSAAQIITRVQNKFAPDQHLAIYHVWSENRGGKLVLSGEVDNAKAKQETEEALTAGGYKIDNEISVLPSPELGEKTWAISTLSVANGREDPEQKAELGTQLLMGHAARLWKQSGRWLLMQTRDGYFSWVERASVVRCTEAEKKAWEDGPLLIATAMEDQIYEHPSVSSQPISDIVLGNLVKRVNESGDWYEVQLPDQRKGFVAKKTVQDFREWKQSRKPSPDALEETAKLFLGRPYLWGANSPKGLDCSGFTKTVFFMNGIALNRNASHQALQGKPVPLDDDLAQLRKGDLLFFAGRRREESGGRRISHVALYLGNKLFIQSSGRVRISSLDPASPLYDEQYGRSLVAARRILQDHE